MPRRADDELRPEEFPDEHDLGDDEDAGESDVVPCPNCGWEVYEDAQRCPHCGQWISGADSSASRPWWWVVLAAAALIAFVLVRTLR